MPWLPPEYSEEDRQAIARLVRRGKAIVAKASVAIAEKLTDVTAADVAEALTDIEEDYSCYHADVEIYETASEAKATLLDVVDKANQLLAALSNLGFGAIQALNRNPENVAIDSKVFDELTGNKAFRPYRWEAQISALSKAVKSEADKITQEIHKGGRISFTTRLGWEPPEELLARLCREYINKHGCHIEAVVHQMVLAVLDSSRGGEITKSAGRKAVRKTAQTLKKSRTV